MYEVIDRVLASIFKLRRKPEASPCICGHAAAEHHDPGPGQSTKL